jgi:glyoxalase family protein
VLLGLHHVTAIAGEPRRCIEFYESFLGLRLVKKTVNFDDPGTYHFYFGDQTGALGTILTFFAWYGTSFRGRRGTGQTTAVAFAVPKSALELWTRRAKERGLDVEGPATRFGEDLISFSDPDGLALELVASAPESDSGAITRLHSVTLSEEGYERTAGLVTANLGFSHAGEAGNRFRFKIGDSIIDLLCQPDARRGAIGPGTIHHIAFRTADDPAQLEWRKRLVALGYNVSPVMDRRYFHSIYFREPGGVLFEIATDLPGFQTDEPADRLGEQLQLPPWLEPMRASIERRLPQL